MKLVIAFLLLAVSMGYGQLPESSNIDITGDAAINVAPDRVRTDFGVETRTRRSTPPSPRTMPLCAG